MALTVWTELSGYSFGTINEREQVDRLLPVTNDIGVTYKIISGKLPPGLRIEGNRIVGTPYEVPRLTEFSFCVRASLNSDISDRTFKITINGPDAPEFITPEGNLDMGNNQYYVLDSTYVDYQIEVTDYDTAAGQKLSFFIASNDGELPPGLVLTQDGRIVGFVQPVLAITPEDGNGTYDNSYYDAVAFDFAVLSSNGYDSWVYDNVFFDYSLPSAIPKKLNRNYSFIVSVTDGDSVVKREFNIFVVGDDYFRADNTVWLNGTGLFTADATYLRAPIWLTRSDLGTYRANNYITVVIDTYDTANVIYSLEQVNANVVAKTDRVAFDDNIQNSTSLTIKDALTVPEFGHYISFSGRVEGATSQLYQVSNVASLGNNRYRLTLTRGLEVDLPEDVEFLIGTLSTLPNGMLFDEGSAEIFGRVPYQPAISKTYNFTVTASRISDKGELVGSHRMFTIKIIGEVDSIITWLSGSDLGAINANFVSLLKVEASTTIPNSVLLYSVTEGRLPPGLSLNLDGEIVGKVNQYGDPQTNTAGLTTFDFANTVTTFDNSTSTFDRVYTFTVKARDIFGYSASTRTFSITINTPNELVFSNIRTKPYLELDQRSAWADFINDTSVFTPSSIYRPNDPEFGLQTSLSMVVYAGIETTDAAKYVSAMGLNHKRKQFYFGSVKKATAVYPGTKTPVYEIVYIEMIDPLEPDGKRLPNKIQHQQIDSNKISVDNSKVLWSRTDSDLRIPAPASPRPEPYMSIDSNGYLVSDSSPRTFYPNSITNWRERFRNWLGNPNDETSGFARERNYLPLWMRSIQPGTKTELGFTLAVPLCYCKVGTADDIILNIKYSGFDFKDLNYTVERYIIDSVEGQSSDKYLVFRNDRITV